MTGWQFGRDVTHAIAIVGGMSRGIRLQASMSAVLGTRREGARRGRCGGAGPVEGDGSWWWWCSGAILRGVPEPIANLAGEIGVLAFKRGYAKWSEGERDAEDGLAPYTVATLEELRAASAALG